tara:strand:+ start:915 stop:1349 length:435 start_codon:yes stop_codon:yes gene_type:complete
MSVTITGLADLDVAFKKFMFNTEQAVDDAVRVTAIKVQRSAIKSIREPSMGTYVTRYTAGGNPYQHVASKPGSSPNNDTGRLMGSIALDHHKGKQVAYVGTNVDYGFLLETVMNRPWLEPAKKEQVAFFKKNLTDILKKQIDKA